MRLGQSGFNRHIIAKARSKSGQLLLGADFEWFLDSQPAGSGCATDGQCEFTLLEKGVVSVLAKYEGVILGPVELSNEQTWYDFHFDVDPHPQWHYVAMRNSPAIIGVFFMMLSFAMTYAVHSPTSMQRHITLALFAIGAGGFGGEISGFIKADLKFGEKLIVSAGGACAVFALVFFFFPAGTA